MLHHTLPLNNAIQCYANETHLYFSFSSLSSELIMARHLGSVHCCSSNNTNTRLETPWKKYVCVFLYYIKILPRKACDKGWINFVFYLLIKPNWDDVFSYKFGINCLFFPLKISPCKKQYVKNFNWANKIKCIFTYLKEIHSCHKWKELHYSCKNTDTQGRV